MLEDIFNFRRVGERLLTAGQPTEAQFRELAAAGCRAVVNLHMNDPRWALPGEEQLAAELGMQYHHIPVVFDAPQPADYARFEALMRQLGDTPTLAHCVANYRVSAFTALYGERVLGWDRARADAFIRDVWEPDAVWQALLQQVRVLDGAPLLADPVRR